MQDFLLPNRRFVCEGTFNRRTKKSRDTVRLFLFTDGGGRGRGAHEGRRESGGGKGFVKTCSDGVLVLVREGGRFGSAEVSQWPLPSIVFEHVVDDPGT
jgi:hypothetical protein